ncbi:MAG: hypothetical protein COA71_13620 [SAR86 cluster bacterium]|uniref:Uncharacterized protein n=1 Tax=SAR86 cluster bacterium TaxID=2030880 RepID=A0A2A5C6Q2_9GAMM|nr:MAG: hypothetical protein COA71_13620 [SAR86 cluster bacterium]
MDEITRQEYLNSMGIQSYFPRYVLPAAKLSDQCEWPEALTQEVNVNAEFKKPLPNEPQPADVTTLITTLITTPKVVEAIQQAEVKAEKKTGTEIEEVRFQLAIIQVNDDVLVLVLLPYMHASNSLNTVQRQLFINIFNALYQGSVNLNLEVKPFRWPFSEALHIEKDANAAKVSLGAYLEQLKGKLSFNSIIVMGEKIAPLIDAGENESGSNYGLTVCRSLDEMLKMPQLKREAWSQLKNNIPTS